MSVLTMSMGAYDEDEHERREMKSSTIDADFDSNRQDYHGQLKFTEGESADALLDQFKQLQSR